MALQKKFCQMTGRKMCKRVLALCTISVLALASLTGCGSNKTETPENPTVVEIPTDTTEANTGSLELTENTDSDLKTLFDVYFTSLAKKDTDALNKILQNPLDKDAIEKETAYVEDYKNIRVYSAKGPIDGTYIAYVYYDVKFKDIDTLAPSLIRDYICTNEDGTLYINNASFADDEAGEISAWLDEIHSSEYITNLVNNVNDSLKKAAESDPKLASLIASLDPDSKPEETTAAESSAGEESTAEPSVTESTPEESTPAESTQAESTKPEETTKAPEKKDYEAYESAKTRYVAETANVRSKASASSDKLGKLSVGTKVKALGKKGDWTVIKYEGKEAYVLTELLSSKKVIDFESVNETVEATQNVRMRKSPDESAESLGNLAGGTQVTRTGYNKEWSRIKYDGKTVYVATKYLTK